MEDDKEISAKKPNRRNKFNARFPPNRIKKIIQIDEDIGKMTAAVPVLIGRSVELFAEKLLLKAAEITATRQAKTLSPQHLKAAVAMDPMFHFLAPIVSKVPELETPSTPGISTSNPFPLTPTVEIPLSGKKRGRPKTIKSETVGMTDQSVVKKRKGRTKCVKEKRFNDESDEEDFDDALLDEVSNTGQSGSRIVNGNGFPQLLSQSSSIYTGVTMETSSDIPSSSTSDSSSGTLLTHKKFVFEFPISQDPITPTLNSPLVKSEPSRLHELPTSNKLVEISDEKS